MLTADDCKAVLVLPESKALLYRLENGSSIELICMRHSATAPDEVIEGRGEELELALKARGFAGWDVDVPPTLSVLLTPPVANFRQRWPAFGRIRARKP